MLKLKFKRITIKDMDEISHFEIRQADLNEMRVVSGSNKPLATLLKSAIERSTEWVEICLDNNTGEVYTIYGLGNCEGFGVPWMIGSPSITKHKKDLLQYSKLIIKEMLNQFPLIHNYVDSRNKAHIRWLKHMDFNFYEERDFVLHGVLFKYFYKCRE